MLGIPAGEHDVQRLLYYNFVKCFWNDAFDYETNNMVNFDWYHPHNAWQHTEDEVPRLAAGPGGHRIRLPPGQPERAVRPAAEAGMTGPADRKKRLARLATGLVLKLALPVVRLLTRSPRTDVRRSLWAGTPILTLPVKAKAERLLGVKADTLVFQTYYITSDFRYDLSRWNRGPAAWRSLVLPLLVLLWAACRYQRFHYFCDRGLLPGERFEVREDELRFLRGASARKCSSTPTGPTCGRGGRPWPWASRIVARPARSRAGSASATTTWGRAGTRCGPGTRRPRSPWGTWSTTRRAAGTTPTSGRSI